MASTEMTKLYHKAEDIAGAILEDDDATEADKLSFRISRAANWSNMGTDGDLTAKDRKELRRLAELAEQLEAADAECERTLAARDDYVGADSPSPAYALAAHNHALAVERYMNIVDQIK